MDRAGTGGGRVRVEWAGGKSCVYLWSNAMVPVLTLLTERILQNLTQVQASSRVHDMTKCEMRGLTIGQDKI